MRSKNAWASLICTIAREAVFNCCKRATEVLPWGNRSDRLTDEPSLAHARLCLIYSKNLARVTMPLLYWWYSCYGSPTHGTVVIRTFKAQPDAFSCCLYSRHFRVAAYGKSESYQSFEGLKAWLSINGQETRGRHSLLTSRKVIGETEVGWERMTITTLITKRDRAPFEYL